MTDRRFPGSDLGCCLCGGSRLTHLLTLEKLPISHRLRKSREEPDPRFDVDFDCCQECGLLQILRPLPSDLIYAESETYTTGFQRPRHLEDLIATTIARRDPGRAIDVGCNDGSLMEALRRAGYSEVIGVEPNPTAATAAHAKGFTVHGGYLTLAMADAIVAGMGEFDCVFMRHVAEHVRDLAGFFAAVRRLLRPDGVLVVELPEIETALALGSPAILWEEHVSYFTRELAEHMLERFGFAVTDRRAYAFGGGSTAFVARKAELPPVGQVKPPDPALTHHLLATFKERLELLTRETRHVVAEARACGHRVVVYGAGPRSCVFLSACRLGGSIDLVIDDREDIGDRLMPGTDLPIRPLSALSGAAEAPLLVLLGVGSENEFKVRARIEDATRAEPIYVSLFPPRDTLASLAEARGRLVGAGRRG